MSVPARWPLIFPCQTFPVKCIPYRSIKEMWSSWIFGRPGARLAACPFRNWSNCRKNSRIRAIIKKYFLRKYANFFRGFSVTIIKLVRRKEYILLNMLFTAVKWYLAFIATWLLFRAFNFDVAISNIAIVTSMIKIITLIPISISGLGVSEVSGTYAYYLLGVPLAIGANMLVASRIKFYLISAIIYFSYIKGDRNAKRNTNTN